MEEWKDVVGFEGLYQVSSFGRVKKSNGRELSQRKDKDGYLIVTLFKEKIRPSLQFCYSKKITDLFRMGLWAPEQ